ncbi:MAG: hypothetical protein IKK36_03085 [Bacteroidales bacterium]|nr:hypothetical protein [Bacteroidales bacterium]MBR3947261.1 hypothetical protein [Bacteroidales bacterium]
MKKALISILFLLVSASVFVSAQNNQCVMCGTWKGIYTFPMPASAPEGGVEDVQFKRIIRIEQYGTDYIVRVKDMPISNLLSCRICNAILPNISICNAQITSICSPKQS